jgi:hypothetical protein
MWYKTAFQYHPSGQLSLFPEMDYTYVIRDLTFNVKTNFNPETLEGQIFVTTPLLKQPVGELLYTINPKTKTADIERVFVIKLPKERMPKYLREKIGDEAEINFQKLGIGNLLYTTLKELLQKKPFDFIENLTGNNISLESYNAKNKVFGLPHQITPKYKSTDPKLIEKRRELRDKLYYLTGYPDDNRTKSLREKFEKELVAIQEQIKNPEIQNLTHEEALQELPPAAWDKSGTDMDFIGDGGLNVTHKLK